MTEEQKLQLKESPVTQFWVEHPNKGWNPQPPCEAGSSLVLLKWRIALGTPPDQGAIRSKLEILLFAETAYWEAKAKGFEKNEIRIWSLLQTIGERLKIAANDDVKMAAMALILEKVNGS